MDNLRRQADMSQDTCKTPGCDRPRQHGYYCNPCRWTQRHPERQSVMLTCERCGEQFDRTGKTGPKPRYCSQECRRGVNQERECVGCGGPFTTKDPRQKYCRRACVFLRFKHMDGRPRQRECVQCGALIDLTERMKDGRLKWPVHTTRCGKCQAKARPHRYCMTAVEVAHRDGTRCRWCGKPVDLNLVGSRSQMAPSVDHIVPWSLGGADVPENLQLMHRKCNSQKGIQQFPPTPRWETTKGVPPWGQTLARR